MAKAFCALMCKMLRGNLVTIAGGYLAPSEKLSKFSFKFSVFRENLFKRKKIILNFDHPVHFNMYF